MKMKKEANAYKLPLEEMTGAFGGRLMTPEEEYEADLISKQVLLSEKYRRGLKTITRMKMKELRIVHPEWTLKETLVAMLNGYNPDLPPVVLLEITQFIINEWVRQPQQELAMA